MERFGKAAQVALGEAVVKGPWVLANGWESEILAIDTPTQHLVIRAYNGAGSDWKAKREFAAMRHLHGLGFPVPSVLALVAEAEVAGKPFVVMERIDGPLLSTVYDEGDEATKADIFTKYWDTLAGLHRLDCTGFDPEGADLSGPFSYIDWLLAHIAWLLGRSGAYSQDLRSIIDMFAARRAEVPCARYCVTHGDYHGRNILMRPGGTPTVIDWSQTRVGDPRYDLGWTLLLSGADRNPAMVPMLVKAYGDAMGEQPEAMDYYIGLAAALRLAVVCVSLAGGTEALGMHKQALDAMKASGSHYRGVYTIYRDATGRSEPVFDRLMEQLA